MFTEIIIPIIEAKSVVTFHQRVAVVKSLERILSTPNGGQILVELYINYDCDPTTPAEENIWERLLSCLANLMTANLENPHEKAVFSSSERITGAAPAITTTSLTNYTKEQVRELYSVTGDLNILKKSVLRLLVRGILQPLVSWCHERAKKTEVEHPAVSIDDDDLERDDPSMFQNQKLRKQLLAEGVKRFNQKYKKGLRYLIDSGCIPSPKPRDIAEFLLKTEGLDKNSIGEYLGEVDEDSIHVMHCFVDLQDFSNSAFVPALRSFLQHFRLPGEAQKIDRFMLKFAERFVKGNPTSFSSADTAYVLAYSVIMLNTDQHNAQVKKRMTKQDFLKNNRGIDEGKDIPEEILGAIFDEIAANEIKMKNEDTSPTVKSGDAQSPVRKTRSSKLQGITHNLQNLDSKFEDLPLIVFYTAHQLEHVKSMFQIIWMSCLMCVSSFLQKSDDMDTIVIALEGFKAATHIACLFDLELERKGFVSNLSKFTFISKINELPMKNVEAIKMLIEMAYVDGNFFEQEWALVIKCISQLDKVQIAGLADVEIPDVKKREAVEAVYEAIASQQVTLATDKIFAQSGKLSVKAITYLVSALCDMSWDEILMSSSDLPRMYCLQRLVEIVYYNMKRIRLEWSQIWQILGPHVTRVACHQNSNVAYFALDKLRQLSIKFLDIDELSNFKFQKEFLRPFEVALENSNSKIKDMVLTCLHQMVQSKSSKLRSGWRTIFATFRKASLENTGIVADLESLVSLAFSAVKVVNNGHIPLIIQNRCLPDYVNCLVSFCLNQKFQKISLNAVELLRKNTLTFGNYLMSESIQLEISEQVGDVLAGQGLVEMATPLLLTELESVDLEQSDSKVVVWLPFLIGLDVVIVKGELEVRTR